MNDDDSGDEAEARHLLEKRRTQAKYDAVRGDSGESDRSVVEKAAEPGLMDSLLRCLITPPQPIDRRRSTMASAGVFFPLSSASECSSESIAVIKIL